MHTEALIESNKRLPWSAIIIFTVITVMVKGYTNSIVNLDLGIEDNEVLFIVFGTLGSLFAAFVKLSFQYIFIKFPTQWISKESNVYTYDLWNSILYSSTIKTVLDLFVQEYGYQSYQDYQGVFTINLIVNVISTSVFLFLYFSGKEKKWNVKKAIITVQVIFLLTKITLNGAALLFLNNIGI